MSHLLPGRSKARSPKVLPAKTGPMAAAVLASAVAALALPVATGAASAAPSSSPAVYPTSAIGVEQLEAAADLADLGRAMRDPLLLVATARVVIASGVTPGPESEPEPESKAGAKDATAPPDTLLVSHWRVRDDATACIATRADEIAAATPAGSQKPSRAAALQQSMRELMNDTSQDKSGNAFAHPSAWAPFTLVGVER